MISIFEYLSDDVMTMVDIADYDIEYSFSADCLSWWSLSITIDNDEIFE